MPKAIKVHTPGSGVFPVKKKRGRPKNIKNSGQVVKKGTRRKGNYRSKYTQEDFKLAMESIQDGMSVRKAAEEFNVPRVTLMDRLHNRTTEKLGRPCELTEEEENLLAERVKLMGDWGFPLTMIDVRKLVQDYLNSTGKKSRWLDNYPGEDWAYGFVKRRKDLSNRMSNLIKRSRAALSREQVKEFVDNYTRVAADIPPSNVFNYDETNLTEDPGAKKALYRRGVKYAEKVCNHSKSSLSVMFCGSADGKMLPPYVVYKAKNLYESWCQGGPKGTRYNATASGWFDMAVFEDWFEKLFLPEVRRIPGTKVLIGDNLASHISTNVIELCRLNDVEFVCLPPNSTHVLQPLDVAVYGPLKNHWRKILRELLKREPDAKALNKPKFPGLLKRLTESLDSKSLLQKGFDKCGIFPISCDKPFSRIPDKQFSAEQMSSTIDQSLLETLEVRRFNKDSSGGGGGGEGVRGIGRGGASVRGRGRGRASGRGKKVAPGMSYTSRDGDRSQSEQSSSSSDSQSESEDERGGEESDRDDDHSLEDSDSSGDQHGGVEADSDEEHCGDVCANDSNDNSELQKTPEADPWDYQVGSYVVAIYENHWYIAQVEGEDPDEETEGFTLLHYMDLKGFNKFTWGEKKDILKTNNKDIICAVSPPIPVSSRAMGLKQEDLDKVMTGLQ